MAQEKMLTVITGRPLRYQVIEEYLMRNQTEYRRLRDSNQLMEKIITLMNAVRDREAELEMDYDKTPWEAKEIARAELMP